MVTAAPHGADHAASVPAAPAVDDTPGGPAAIVGVVLLVLLVVACVTLARREAAATTALAMAAQVRAAAAPVSESDRIRNALIAAQAAAERAWRAGTPAPQRAAQEAEMMVRFRSEEQSVVMLQQLRQATAQSAASAASEGTPPAP